MVVADWMEVRKMDDVNVVLNWMKSVHDFDSDTPAGTFYRLTDDDTPDHIAERYLNMNDWQDAKLLIKFGEWLLQESKK